MPRVKNKGLEQIGVLYIVYCGEQFCSNWSTEESSSKRAALATFVSIGWKFDEETGKWICRPCQEAATLATTSENSGS